MTLKFGLIGAGNSAKNIATSLVTGGKAQLLAITSADMNESKRVAEKHQIPKVYASYKEMLLDKEIDCVIVSVPHHLHHPITLDALNAGKHVLCEKPLAINMQQGNEMVALAKAKDLRLGTFFQNRFSDASQKAKQMVDNGEIGQILHAQANVLWSRDQEYYNASSWRGKWATEGGGSLINQASHTIDLMVWLSGKPKTVFGVFAAKTHQIEVDDNAAAVVLFENGIYGTIQTSTSIEPGFPALVNVFGTKGMISINGNYLKIVKADGKEEHLDFDKQQVGSANDPKKFSLFAQQRILADFIDAVEHHRSPKVDGYEGLRAIQVINAIYESNGQKVIHL